MPPSYIRVRAVVWAYGRGQTDRHTDARDHNTFCIIRNEYDVGGRARFGLSYGLGVCIMSIYSD